MPRCRPLIKEQQIEYDLKVLTEQLLSDIATKNIKKKDIAQLSGVTPGALSQQLSKRQMTIKTFLAWQRLKDGELSNEKRF